MEGLIDGQVLFNFKVRHFINLILCELSVIGEKNLV